MDIVTLGAALNGSAEYVNSHFKGGSNIQIVDNPDGTQTINASGEVSAEDTVARAEIAEMKDGTNIDSFGDVETALATKANASTTYTKTEVDTALSAKANSADVYTKTAVDTALGNKADKSTTYTKTEVDTALSAKADKSTTYTKTEVDTALDDKVDKETGKGLSTNDYTTAEKTKLAGIAEGAEVNVQSNWTQTTTTADDYIKNKPTLGTAAAKNATDTYNATGTDVTTGKAVAAALATLPEPMVFKGSLGTGGTITTLPTASSSNKGYVYKVITAGTYASQSAKVGDTFVSDGSAWVLIPSGDEPSGTVTNVAVANGGGLTVSGSPITSSGTITVGHSNSVTAKTSSSVKKFTYDAYGHVTGSSELSTAESDALASGIDSEKVEQIETNKNNILLLEQMNGAKNIVDYAKADLSEFPNTTTGATASLSGDEWTINGTTNATGVLLLNIYFAGATTKIIPNGEYVAQIFPTIENAQLQIVTDNIVSNGNRPITFTVTDDDTRSWARLYLANNQTFNNAKIKLMIIPKSLWDAGFTDYQPYAMSNVELTAKEQANENNISTAYGGIPNKNKFNIYNLPYTYNLTINEATGVCTQVTNDTRANLQFGIWKGSSTVLSPTAITANGIYHYSFTKSAGDTTIRFGHNGETLSSQITYDISDFDNGIYVLQLNIINCEQANGKYSWNQVMICSQADYTADPSYQPYAMSNAELTAAIQALQAQLANQ